MQSSRHHMLCKWCDAHRPSTSAGSAASGASRGLPAAPAAAAPSAGRARPRRPRAPGRTLELRTLYSEGPSTMRGSVHRGGLQARPGLLPAYTRACALARLDAGAALCVSCAACALQTLGNVCSMMLIRRSPPAALQKLFRYAACSPLPARRCLSYSCATPNRCGSG